MPHSAVQEHDHIPKEAVRSRLIQKGKEKGLQIHVGQIREQPSLSRITNQHPMELRTRRTLRCNCGPKITPLSLQRQSASAGPKIPMNQLEVHHEDIKIKERLYEESGKGNTRLQPTTRSLKESTKTGWVSLSSSLSWWKSSDKMVAGIKLG